MFSLSNGSLELNFGLQQRGISGLFRDHRRGIVATFFKSIGIEFDIKVGILTSMEGLK